MSGTVIPSEYEGSLCEIKTIENVFITTARVSSVSSERIKLQIKGKAFRSVRFGSRVKVSIINAALGFRVIEGKVFTYSFGTLTLVDIFSIVEKERRKSLRVDMNTSSKAYFDNTYTGKQESADIVIRDMSMFGVRFTSRHHFDMGSQITFGLDLGRRKFMELSCSVIRRGSEASGGEMSYIGRLNNAARQEEEICSFLFQKQGELYNKSK